MKPRLSNHPSRPNLGPAKIKHLSLQVVGAAIAVHGKLGPGLLESVYETHLIKELRRMGLVVKVQLPTTAALKKQGGTTNGLRLGLLVAETIIVDLQSVATVQLARKQRLMTCLRLAGKPLGLLINFNVTQLKDGIEQIVNIPDLLFYYE